jgi:hypothetical protein
MTQLAVGYKTLSGGGREHKSDGLITHLGDQRNVGTLYLGAPVTSNARLLGYNIDDPYTPGERLVQINALTVTPGSLHTARLTVNGPTSLNGTLTMPAGTITTTMLAAGAAQQQLGSYFNAVSGWSTTVLNAWVATAVSLQATTAGGLLRLEASLPLYHSVGGAGFYVGWMLDGNIQNAMAYYISPGINYTVNFGMTWYATPAAGLHTFALAVYSTNAGALSINAAAVATLYVTEQKR